MKERGSKKNCYLKGTDVLCLEFSESSSIAQKK